MVPVNFHLNLKFEFKSRFDENAFFFSFRYPVYKTKVAKVTFDLQTCCHNSFIHVDKHVSATQLFIIRMGSLYM